MLNTEKFKASIAGPHPPMESSLALQSLWEDAKGNWETAHRLAQEDPSLGGAWVHAYLHRKEGDLQNAAYWYAQVNRDLPDIPVAAEWEELVRTLIHDQFPQ